MTVRVYVPSTLPLLRSVLSAGELGPVPLPAHAVTDAVRAELGGEEDQEYAACAAAARACLPLLADGDPARRVVLAVDVEGFTDAAAAADPTRVLVHHPVTLLRVGAVLADSADAETAVARARAASGTADEVRLLDALEDHELGWWAVQEADVLLAEAGLGG